MCTAAHCICTCTQLQRQGSPGAMQATLHRAHVQRLPGTAQVVDVASAVGAGQRQEVGVEGAEGCRTHSRLARWAQAVGTLCQLGPCPHLTGAICRGGGHGVGDQAGVRHTQDPARTQGKVSSDQQGMQRRRHSTPVQSRLGQTMSASTIAGLTCTHHARPCPPAYGRSRYPAALTPHRSLPQSGHPTLRHVSIPAVRCMPRRSSKQQRTLLSGLQARLLSL